MARVQGKVAIVTGAASGIGRAAAELLAREGASVLLTDRNETDGRAAADAINTAGGEAAFVRHDVTDEADWASVVDGLMNRTGRLDVLVNNAGVSGGLHTIDETTLDDWRACLSVNLDGVFLGVKHGARAMRRSGGGSIINISSVLGMIGMPRAAAYVASKGGVRLLTKAAALEFATSGDDIRVNSVHPGFIRTPMTKAPDPGREAEWEAFMRAMQPTGEIGDPTDIAEGILHLASDASRFMTGSELVIDGGITAR
ncbi:MAG: glucose 1-dehydrogenase [Alphaproteobacteria bacterium]|nr:glucose 1-dehydrogenase [Alphaproteobacteria bacterium]